MGVAERIVIRIMRDLSDRSGFDLYDLDDDIRNEIRETWIKIVNEELNVS